MARRREIVHSIPQIDYTPATQYVDFADPVKGLDFDFISNSFLPDLDFIEQGSSYADWMYKSEADLEYMDTSLGGSIAINLPYGNTSFADLPRYGRASNDRKQFIDDRFSINHGMGRNYHETIMQHSQPRILIMEFGVPEHRSMFSFFTEAISFRESIIAKEGRSPFLFDIGKAIGTAAVIIGGGPLFGIAASLIYLAEFALDVVFGDSDSRYYKFKTSMSTYILGANSIFKELMIERGLLKYNVSKADLESTKDNVSSTLKFDTTLMQELRDEMPNIFNKGGEIDMFRIVARPQLIAGEMLRQERDTMLKDLGVIPQAPIVPEHNLQDFVEKMFSLDSFKNSTTETGRNLVESKSVPTSSANINPDEYATVQKSGTNKGSKKRLPHDKTTYFQDAAKMFKVTREMGFESVSFYVDYVGSSTYTFTNETKDIPAKGVLNTVGGASRDIEFSLGGTATLGGAVDSVIKGARDVVAGTLEGATFGLTNVLASLAGGGYISFPKMWSDSSVSLPTHTFKMVLGGPYGNILSRVMDIDAPLSLILAGSLPLSVGRASYTSPFLARAFLRGIIDIDFGMITNLTITAGTGVVARDLNGAPLQIEVQFTVTDFTDIVTARVSDSLLATFDMAKDEYGALNKILRTLAGRGYRTSRYKTKGFNYRLTALQSDIKSLGDPARLAAYSSDTIVSELFKLGKMDDKITSMFSN